jgi:hypothetical protein
MQWLPCWRIATNPCRSRILQTFEPERTRSLPNGHLDLRNEDLVAQPLGNFRRRRSLEKQRQSLDQIGTRLFNRGALARNIELGT